MDAIEKLRNERRNLAARLADIDNILIKYDDLQRLAENFFSVSIAPTAATDSGNSSETPPRELTGGIRLRRRSNLPTGQTKTPMEVFELVTREILAAADKPLDRAALYGELRKRDIVIGSPDDNADLNTLSARMSRMTATINVRGYGYWLKDRSFPEGGYMPTSFGDGMASDEETDSLI